MINCPNKNLPEFQALVAVYGEGRATAAWRNNNEIIPTVEQAASILGLMTVPEIRSAIVAEIGNKNTTGYTTVKGNIITVSRIIYPSDAQAYRIAQTISNKINKEYGADTTSVSERTVVVTPKKETIIQRLQQEVKRLDKIDQQQLERELAETAINGNVYVNTEGDVVSKDDMYYQLPSTEGKVVAEQTIRDIASRMSERIGIPVRFESDRTKEYKGKIDGNTAIINLAYATMDTPIHEVLGHPIIRAIKGDNINSKLDEKYIIKETTYGEKYGGKWEYTYLYNNEAYSEYFKTKEEAEKYAADNIKKHSVTITFKQLYQNLLKELEFGVGKEVYDRIKKDYNTYTTEEQQEEALVELLGLMTADRLDRVKDGKLISLLKRLLKEIASYVRNLLGAKEIEIDKLPDNMTLGDIADVLAYSNSKLILPGYEVLYTTPDNQKFKSYGEASAHISELAKLSKNVDIPNISDQWIVSWGVLYRAKDSMDTKNASATFNTKKEAEDFIQKLSRDSRNIDISINTGQQEFIEKNKQYEQSKEIIEEWKRINNIKYNPEEVYSRGQGFYSVVGAYSNFDVNLMFQNILQHIEDNQKAGGEFVISAFTKPVDRNIHHLEGGGGKIKFVIYPQSEDIKWAANSDVYSGSVWDASAKVSKDKKSELLGVSYTKAPALENLHAVKPNLAEIIDDLQWSHNELGIALTGKNFRIEYDENVPATTKKLINSINSILSQKFGNVDKSQQNIPNNFLINGDKIYKKEGIWYKNTISPVYYKVENEQGDLVEIDDYYVEEKEIDYNEVKKLYREGIQPTITSSNVKENIDDVKKQILKGQVTAPSDLADIREDYEDGKITKEVYDRLTGKTSKEYTSQALINKKIAALKEVAKKYPRSLIVTEVKRKMNKEYGGYEQPFMFDDELPFQKLPSSVSTTTNISKQIEQFIQKLGGRLQYVPSIVIDGRVVPANAVADVVTRTISIVEGKESVDTLPEEAAHIYIALLPDNHPLKVQMMKDIVGTQIYKDTYKQYNKDPLYQTADGKPDSNKIAIETIGKRVAQAIVGSKDKAAQSWWQKLWTVIKNIFRNTQDIYDKVAQDILSADVSRLDLNAAKKAQSQGRYYLELTPEEDRFYRTIESYAKEEQKVIINDLIRNPIATLIEPTHQYIATDPNDKTSYMSVTTAIGVEGPTDGRDYTANAEWGNDFDRILRGVVERKNLDAIAPTPYITDVVRQRIYDNLERYITSYTSQGIIPLTQVVVADKLSGIAGSIDLLWVYPNGTMQVVDLKTSWSSISSDAYWNYPRTLSPTSKIYNKDRKAITKKQQQAIQVGTYDKLLRLMGYNKLKTPITKHYRVADKEGVVIDFVDEGTVEHKPSSMEGAINDIVPTQLGTNNKLEELGIENPIVDKKFKEEEEKALTDTPAYTEEEKGAIEKGVREIVNVLTAYKNKLVENTRLDYTANRTPIANINRVYNDMLIEIGTGNWEGAYIQFLDYANTQVQDLIGYVKNPANYNNPANMKDYEARVPIAQEFIHSLSTVLKLHSWMMKNPTMNRLSLSLNDWINVAQDDITQAFRNITAIGVIQPNTSNPLLTSSVLAEKLLRDTDITTADSIAGDLANSGSVILENLDKSIKTTVQESKELGEKDKARIAELGDELMKVMGSKDPKVLYDIMFQKNERGGRTGRILNAIGIQYWKLRDELQAPTLNIDGRGEPLLYKTDPQTTEDLEYNIKLHKAKKALAEFYSPEITDKVNGEWVIRDGAYHILSNEYKNKRDELFEFSNGEWLPKPNKQKEVMEFRNKYMEITTERYKMIYEQGQPTGRVELNSSTRWMPKREHIVIREIAANGTDMRDPAYKDLSTSKDPKKKAQYKFLTGYRSIMGKQVLHLTPMQQVWYQKQYIPALASNFVQQLGRDGTNFMQVMGKELKDWFTVKAYVAQTDMQRNTGSLSQSLPLIYTANMQSQERLDLIVRDIAEHNAKKETLTTTREKILWEEESKRLELLRQQEMNRLTPEEIHPDLTVGALAFIDMTTKFRATTAVQDKVRAALETIRNMTLYQDSTDFFGKVIGRKEVSGEQSRTFKRLSTYLEQILQYDETANKSTLDVIANKAMKITSATGMAFNWLGHAHNVITGRINNHIESFGDEAFSRRALRRMRGYAGVDGEVSRAIAAKAVQTGQLLGSKSYKTPPPASKYEALAKEFNMVEHQVDNDPGRVNLFGEWGYATMQGGEWMVQTEVGNSILDSIILHNDKGDELSIYDAYNFEETTGKLSIASGWKLPNGEEYNEQQRRKIHNRIRETNKKIHGNYRDIDRTALERHWQGKIIFQYHKWIYPAYRARFQATKWDENIGTDGSWYEGRYRSAAAFVKGLMNNADTIENKWKSLIADTSKMTQEDKMKFIKDNFEWIAKESDYKMLDQYNAIVQDKIEKHQNLKVLMRSEADMAMWRSTMESLLAEKKDINDKVEQMLIKLLDHRRNNLYKAGADLLYISMLFATYIILKGLSSGIPDDDVYTKRLVNWMMWEADRNLKEVELMTPFGVVESYQLIKSPIPALSSVRDFGQIIDAMVQYPFVDDDKRVLQRGPHKGEYKVWKEFTDIVPIWKQYNRVLSFDNIDSYFIK